MAQALPKDQQNTRQGLLIQMPNRQTSSGTPSADQNTADDESHAAQSGMTFSLVLIVFESLLTFLLRHDPQSQRLAEKLIAQQAVIRIRTHLPAYTFYATFSHHGVLLDDQANAPDYVATVDASVPTLLRAFMTAPPHILDSILIHGADDLVADLRQLMTAFNINNMLSYWLSFPWFGRDKTTTQPPAKQQRVKPLLKRIDEQKKQIEQLNVTVKQQAHELQQMQFQYKMLAYVAGTAVTLLIVTMMFLLLR